MKKLLFSAVTLDIGGIETALVTLLNYLASQKENEKNKYEITLVLEKKQGLFLYKIKPNIKIIEYSPSNNKIIFFRKLINFIKQIKFRIQYSNKFDFSCSYATYSKPASFVARAASKNSTLWVHSEYMQMLNNNKIEYINFFNGINLNKFKNIVFVSENSKKIFEETMKECGNNKALEKTILIHNLIDYNTIIDKSKLPIDDISKESMFTFLNVGRHTEEDKRITRIIEAAKKLKDDNLKFRILLVGDGKETENYKKLVEKYNLQEEIKFLGRKQNPYPYFKIADSLLLTSEYEGLPVVYIEAMILGLPIITTDVSDSKRIIENKFGIVTEKNIDSIYNAMKQVVEKGIKNNLKFDYEKYNLEIKEKLEKLIENNVYR